MADSSVVLNGASELDQLFANEQLFQDDNAMESCFTAANKDRDGLLTLSDFGSLCRALFRNEQGKAYSIDEKQLQEMFDVFDVNQDGYIDGKEFRFCWQHWIKPIVHPVSALIVVDVQNDFIGGCLPIFSCAAKQDGEEVIEPINNMLETVSFDGVFYSLDWHPDNHVSFVENVKLRKMHPSSKVSADEASVYDTVVFEGSPPIEIKLWPKHCVENSWGADFHPKLKVHEKATVVHKGTDPDVDSFSAFSDNTKRSHTELLSLLQKQDITDVYICGLAYDVCVGATAKDAVANGLRTVLVEDACRGVSLEDIEDTRNSLIEQHATVVQSSQVKAMVEGRDRRPELGYFSAMRLRDATKDDGHD